MAVRHHRNGAIAELIPEELGEMTTAILQMADADGRTAIHEAASQGHVEILSRLLLPYDRSNAEDQLSSIVDFVPSENVSGRTALHEASRAGHLAMVKYLLDHCRANVDAVDNDANTPLMFACQQLHEGVAKTLVDRGARRDVRNRKGGSAEDILAEHIGAPVVNNMRLLLQSKPFEETVRIELSRWRQQNSWWVEKSAAVDAHSTERIRFQAAVLEILSASRVNFFAARSTLDSSIQSDVVEKSLAKALATMQSLEICEHGDVEAAMKELGNALSTGSPVNHIIPFLVLAYARHALTTFNTALAVGLLQEFRSRVDDECARSMLSSPEFELLAREQSHIDETFHIGQLPAQSLRDVRSAARDPRFEDKLSAVSFPSWSL